ncbi:ParB/RepB/Spo0J family partition protein [Sphingomonas sp. DT-204]|uniref:ParB/RepB/Spo0J family partition protein n=1 Tax=Sphingomonas sp. DT-204 TaxID=3396166 RepID=UPI003F1D4259
MKLEFVALDKLSISKTNMHYGRKVPDFGHILPSIRKRGILQPLVVRQEGEPEHHGVVGGARRYFAALAVAEETGQPEPVPCAILEQGDDADAVEASILENMARRDPDEVTQWASFVRLVKEGRSIEEIAETFAYPELKVRRILALGNLLPRIRSLYAQEQIDVLTVRHLTLASKSQQREWLALYDSPDAYAPSGHQLKGWLFGGQTIPVKHALFDVERSGLTVVADLFGDDSYFADAEAFWTCQNAEIAARRDAYLAQGWTDAVVVPPSDYFHAYEHEKAPKRKGGRVYIDVRSNGEVTFHEGYVTRKEAARLAKEKDKDAKTTAAVPGGPTPGRPEITSAMRTYIDLHRHAAVRAALTDQPGMALRLMVAHAIAGTHLWSVKAEPQATRDDEVRESIETAPGEAVFDEKRRAVLAMLGFSDEEPTVIGGNGDEGGVAALFLRLMRLDDAQVMAVAAIVMGESLAAGGMVVEAVGAELDVDMARWWTADAAFFEQLRDREVLLALVEEVGGKRAARENRDERGKTLKKVIADHLSGSGGRNKVEGWVPRWMQFPPAAYTGRGGVTMVDASERVAAARAALAPLPEPEPVEQPDPAPAEPLALPAPQSVPEALPIAA